MSQDPLIEIEQFLLPTTRIDVRMTTVDNLLCLSGTKDGVSTLLNYKTLLENIIKCTDEKFPLISKPALLILVNLTAESEGAKTILNIKFGDRSVVEYFIGYILDQNKIDVDPVCMILSNLTRLENELNSILDLFTDHLERLLSAFVDINYNKNGNNLDYIAPMLSNLSRSSKVCEWLLSEDLNIPLLKLLPFCSYMKSTIRRGGVMGVIRNLSFYNEYHSKLLSDQVDILTYILPSIMGNEEYPDEEMDMLPISLQYLPESQTRDFDPDIRNMVLETINRLCARKDIREHLREKGVYYILREYHKWEKDPKLVNACENIVDILIRKEIEIGVDNILDVEVSPEMEKFNKIDSELLSS